MRDAPAFDDLAQDLCFSRHAINGLVFVHSGRTAFADYPGRIATDKAVPHGTLEDQRVFSELRGHGRTIRKPGIESVNSLRGFLRF